MSSAPGYISFRVKPEEYQLINNLYKQSTCRKLSEYARQVLLQQPSTIKYRNATADSYLPLFIEIKNELSALGNNFNQAVKKLHSLESVPELSFWIRRNETTRDLFIKKTEEIRWKLNQLYDIWSRK